MTGDQCNNRWYKIPQRDDCFVPGPLITGNLLVEDPLLEPLRMGDSV